MIMDKASYITEEELFQIVQEEAKEHRQVDIADMLGVKQPTVSQMLKGDQAMISLAIRFLEVKNGKPPIDKDQEGRPIKYYRLI